MLQNNRKAQTYKKKEEELKRTKKINETMKSLMKNKNNKSLKEHSMQSSAVVANPNQIDDHVMHCVKKILGEIDQEKTLQKYQNKIKQLED